ncbi:hypothetical protein GF326_10545 [Candidatus Bathyarchaeota archaeon]|nr:hypothetical protein [Candidatus Bathyarchaeota archaeon]
MAESVTRKQESEETLRRRIRRLKEREHRIRKERQHLEYLLREKIYQKYRQIEKNLEEKPSDQP